MKPINHNLVLGSTVAYTLTPLTSPTTHTHNDADIISHLRKRYSEDKLLQSLNIRITAHRGVVSIIGKVDTDVQYKQAIMLALSTKGVEDINTYNLTMKVAVGV